MTTSITFESSAFDFNSQDMDFYKRNVFSKYKTDLGRSALHARETMTILGYHPRLNVSATIVKNDEGAGEGYVAYFKTDQPETALLSINVQQVSGETEPDEATYLTRVEALEVFDRFSEQHHGMALVSQDGESTLEFSSLVHKTRVILLMADERVCNIACNIDMDENEPSVQFSLEYRGDKEMITVALYAR